jgi:steroid delta-isomerase-like uncharacterized protein
VTAEANKAIIRRYYDELWNQWRLELVDELIDTEVGFRGSLGRMVNGREGLVGYIKHVQSAFPDFHNSIEELIAENDRVVARLIYTGTHRGEIFGIAPTGRRIRYAGVGIFHLHNSRIDEAWVLGDLAGLLLQLRPEQPT